METIAPLTLPDGTRDVIPAVRQDSSTQPVIKHVWWLTFGGFTLLYLLTCQHGISWQDSGWFQWRVLTGDYVGPFGLAIAHPLYIVAGQLFTAIPIGSFAGRLNFFSGVGMAVALANLAVVCSLLTGRRWIGVATAAMLGVAHTAWWLATIAEVYTWSVAGLTAEIWLLVLLVRSPRWQWLAALACISGMGWSIHNFALLPLPVYAAVALLLVLRRQLPVWSLPLALGTYLLGSGLYLGLIIQTAVTTGDPLLAISSALFGHHFTEEVLNTAMNWESFKINAALGSLNFVSFMGPLALIGMVCLRRRIGTTLAAALGAIALIEIAFVIRYPVADQFTFLLPSLVMIAIAAAVGVAVLSDQSAGWRQVAVLACVSSIALPPLIYAISPTLLATIEVDIQRVRELPFRNEARYWLVPWKFDEYSAELFARAALQQATPEGIIIADNVTVNVLRLMQTCEHVAPNVLIQTQEEFDVTYADHLVELKALADTRPLYVVSALPGYMPPVLQEQGTITAEGVLYCVHLQPGNPVLYK